MGFMKKVGGFVAGRARSRAEDGAVISDERLASVLGGYAGMVEVVLDRPEHWLGAKEEDAGEDGGEGVTEGEGEGEDGSGGPLGVVRRITLGEDSPGSAGWEAAPLQERTRWWLRRIGLTAGTAAATPRLAGLLADRVPLQAALGASASGLAVCAVARENGVSDPDAWVPLLAEVIFDRRLGPATGTSPGRAASEQELAEAEQQDADAADAPEREDGGTVSSGGRRAAQGMWRLARTLLAIQGLFNERPHGGLGYRLLARLPVVGVLGGWLDERGAIAEAARRTQKILDRG